MSDEQNPSHHQLMVKIAEIIPGADIQAMMGNSFSVENDDDEDR
jgi:hypothetical protein